MSDQEDITVTPQTDVLHALYVLSRAFQWEGATEEFAAAMAAVASDLLPWDGVSAEMLDEAEPYIQVIEDTALHTVSDEGANLLGSLAFKLRRYVLQARESLTG